ncbi:MAG: hydrogenase formation protein HypD [Armatimonadota bacterium]
MRLVDEFRNPQLLEKVRQQLPSADAPPAVLMEVCGTHTMAIARYGLRSFLPKQVRLVSGPGCPVCVTHQRDIDTCLALTDVPNVIIATFGDMMRVPGTYSSLEQQRASGSDVRMVYSPMDAVRLAEAHPNREVIFLGVGFETTAPAVAASILEADRIGLHNFSVYCAHKLIPPALEALAQAPDLQIDGFILPGHVSTILGLEPYRFLAEKYGKACVVTGFEPLDIAIGMAMLLERIQNRNPGLDIQYTRVVRPDGNPTARRIMYRVFKPADSDWRGIGTIPNSGLVIRSEFAHMDAKLKFADQIPKQDSMEPESCMCGSVLRGAALPTDCRLFGTACTPASPVGPCMVSSEGTCAAFYRYMR